ncbi:hypothetical protein EV356DRAFT_515869 [Viridothelium virens]|uniref:Ras guanyl-nucleotide exchange factor RasGEF n=1 Tax=Viridothelium virens TaxID=1048519 RepID=A0A6A6H7F3_VIRVR|nr:hypothetical protein EV356DRAFT_515869 [Viridothelium virens]
MTAPATSAPQLRSLYRRLLRELPARSPPKTILSHPSPLQQRIRDVTAGAGEGPHGMSPDAAEQFVQYTQAQRMYVTLIERYNPGMGMSEEERVRLTARRVGMDLPVGGTGLGGRDQN